MITSFRDRDTERVWKRQDLRRLSPELQRAARRKLVILDSAQRLEELLSPPGNRLEALRGNRAGQHSIRVNDQYRICFVWTGRDAQDVELVDYH